MLSTKELISAIKPVPMPFDLIRIGNGEDGTYLIPNDLTGIKACFSPGVNNYKYFEDFLANHYGIKSYMCDFSSDEGKFSTPLIQGMQKFDKKWLDINGSDDSISLEEWVKYNEPDDNYDLLLQIDIEGAEFRNLINASESVLKRFRIIIIEIHEFQRLLQDDHNEVRQLISKLSQSFNVVHAHPNNCSGDVYYSEFDINLPRVIEFSFLRKDRFSDFKNNIYFPILPHPMDITNTSERPIYLNKSWLSDNSCQINYSKIKRELHYFDFLSAGKPSKIAFFNASSLINEYLNKDEVNYHVNLAAGKYYYVYPYDELNNSENRIRDFEPFFFHTPSHFMPSITIDLEDSYELMEVKICNRVDSCFDRADSLAYIVHQTVEYDIADAYPVNIPKDFLSTRGMSITKIPSFKGRFLTIVSLKSDPLHFSKIEIFGR